ncbi:transporter [Limnohabitans sp. Jir61]|uniref:YeeE/YedE family protein n=1 Tax=Limnohabitans sp. Jir61 TaxID=1826168 RepID=UPI000D3DBA48|nr:YeeE/YedE family protein [Limnohabitans sp. Jir61]PUE33061.1 transporter [Limnohabitans sp. Jir61]
MTELAALTKEVLGAFFLGGLLLGSITQRTHFCTMGAISDVVHMGDWTRARQWICAIGLAMIGFAALVDLNLINPTKTLYASARLMWLSTLVGGVMFGYGMVIASGCGNKTLVRIGGGNLKSVVVFVVMGISAFATLKGITAVLRARTVDTVFWDMPAGANLSVLGIPGLGYILGAVLLLSAIRHKDFWTFENLLASLGVGGLVVAMWWISGHLGFVSEHPETLDAVYLATNSGRIEALNFVAPAAYTLDWLMFYSDASKVLSAGIASVAGVLMGSAFSAVQTKTFRWEGFADSRDLGQHLLGSVLMGVGGVTAMGCTFGQGLSGISTLSLNSAVALAAIVLGAVVSLRQQAARLERTACA